jgi:predicted dehydrogenase
VPEFTVPPPTDTANPTPAPITLALVGCGAVAQQFYAPALRELERHGLLRVVALADPAAGARSTLAASFSHARAVATVAEALATAPQLTVVASPPRFHREHTEAALAAGSHVLCEKPMAASAAECEALLAAAERAGRFLAVGHYKRFMPAHRALRHFIEHRTFGALRHLAIAEGGKFNWPAASDSFFRREQTPGGVLLDIGVHVLDLLRWWLGEPTDFTYADDARDGLEANALVTATFAGGATTRVRLSRDWKTANCYVFRFERATVHCRVNASNRLELTFDGLPVTFAAELRQPLPPPPVAEATAALESNAEAFIAQLVDVVAAVQQGRPPTVPGSEGARVLRWIERCYAQRQPLAEPWIVQASPAVPHAPGPAPAASGSANRSR